MGSGFMRLARATGPAKDKRLALDLFCSLRRRVSGRPQAPAWASAHLAIRGMVRDAHSRFGPLAWFYAGLKSRQARPSAWLSAPRGATAVRPCRRLAPVRAVLALGKARPVWTGAQANRCLR